MVKKSTNEGAFPTQVPKVVMVCSVPSINERLRVEIQNRIEPNQMCTTSLVKEITQHENGFNIKTLNSEYEFWK